MSFITLGNDNLFLGIDIGDSSLKMVELKKKGQKILLSNYAFSENVSEINFNKVEDVNYLSQAITKVMKEAGMKANRATVSLPTFAVFSSIINIANVDRNTLANGVNEEAKKVIPLPLEEMILDWKVIPDKNGKTPVSGNIQVFLTGSPKKLVRKYIDVFKKAGVILASLETETFSLVRSLIGDDKAPMMIVEIGANSTDLSIVKDSIPVLNRSLTVCASTVTKALAAKLGMTYAQAEQFKLDLSFSLNADASQEDLPQLITKTLEPIITEIQYLIDFYRSQNDESLEKIILSGGGSLFLNLADYFSKRLNIKVIIGNPWSRVEYPQEIKPVLEEVGPKLAVAIGLAMREIE
ncbi:MAG TPA: type IV pilus assembly protein PilM [Candidatus Saccharimonadales bacterium]|nr:type IV pilus assembly protein PilM [Candidatus Saccharimonadales bacterium]